MEKTVQKGKVIIAGAGPGDPELLTIKAFRYLQKADVVLTDRLVSDVIISEYVNPEAEVLYVGKQCRRGASTPQATINELMVDYALQGKLVVRLKGGDVSIFSNVLDELQTLVENKISYEIIPGISAALGAAAYSGIPLTARNHSTAVRFLTCYKTDVVSEEYWKDLAKTQDTLVFYMSAETADFVVAKLSANNIDPEKWIAVVEQATTPLQTVYTSNLYDFNEKLGDKTFKSPSLLIIGKVVQLHDQFRWLHNNETAHEYFTPVEASLVLHNKAERA
jgi:uroporphyrin-III C-methyltransferase/precorrin-2 dehydrogenase/sirohydrochlorin ferrochelatase/uroporphyrin-III C-methyltransferase